MKAQNIYAGLLAIIFVFTGCSGKSNLLGKSGSQRIIAEGLAKYDKKDINASKSMALFEAQKNAVLKLSALFMGVSFDENIKLLEAAVLKNPQLYIKKYKIRESAKYGDYYKVAISGRIMAGRIAADIQGRLPDTIAEKANIMLAIRESYDGKEFSQRPAREGIADVLKKSGNFNFMDLPAVAGEKSMNDSEARNSAADKGADILIIGKANAEKINTAIKGFTSVTGIMDIKCFEIASGKLIYEGVLRSNSIDAEEEKAVVKSLLSAGKMAAGEVSSKIVKSMTRKAPLKIALLAVDEFDKLKKFADELILFDKVSDIRLDSWSDDIAVFHVYGDGLGGEEFASSILRKNIFPIIIENVDNNKMIFRFVR